MHIRIVLITDKSDFHYVTVIKYIKLSLYLFKIFKAQTINFPDYPKAQLLIKQNSFHIHIIGKTKSSVSKITD